MCCNILPVTMKCYLLEKMILSFMLLFGAVQFSFLSQKGRNTEVSSAASKHSSSLNGHVFVLVENQQACPLMCHVFGTIASLCTNRCCPTPPDVSLKSALASLTFPKDGPFPSRTNKAILFLLTGMKYVDFSLEKGTYCKMKKTSIYSRRLSVF